MSFIAKKSLGQNFLHAPQVISAMIHTGEISKEGIVLEVGPGKGALTSKLLETGVRVIAVEKDDRAIPFLKEKFLNETVSGQLEIIHADILEFDETFHEKLKAGYILIANIPYYITGEFIRKFLESKNPPVRMVIMVQKEVAKRIVDVKESILSISVKSYGNPKYICSVPRKFFRPMPNVDSAVLMISDISKKFFENEAGATKINEKYFFEVLKAGFAHKRKVVIRNLEDKIPKVTLEKIWERQNLSKDLRAENISLEVWKKIVGDSLVS
ncbi:MAG: rRNA (adenine1518-N6/adenine1519-N6)-dimethyltransferase [Patescibacteria group bacterium]|nr:rRNA (adenine1518-N6/adenine1519-N6)-dimethyltransferase [Patescibacteria group bacterium]